MVNRKVKFVFIQGGVGVVNISDFRESKYWTFECTSTLWGDKIDFGVVLGEGINDKKQALADYLPIINKKLKWLDESKSVIEKTLMEDNMVSLAEDWASGAKPAEEDKECYIMEDGQRVYLPITQDDFCRSIKINGFTFYCEEGIENVMVDVFLICSPDYFAGHAINLIIKSDGSVVINGLFG